jgi:hypothetical protein
MQPHLTPHEFANFAAFMEWDAHGVWRELVEEWDVDPYEAQDIVTEAYDRRERYENPDLDRLALESEHDLDVSLHDPLGAERHLTEEDVRHAFRCAEAVHESLGLTADEVIALVHGAFLLPFDVAARVADAVTAY